jgi:hypothetical protein
MKKITIINRQICRELQLEIEQVMNKFAETHGLTLEMGRGSYMDTEVHAKIILRTTSGEKAVVNTENSMLSHYGLKIGDQIRFTGGTILTVSGYKSSAPKRPIQLKGSNGKSYVSTVRDCTLGLIKNPA